MFLRREDAWVQCRRGRLGDRADRPEAGCRRSIALYPWWALGAIGLVAWGVRDGRGERVNLGAAIFAATVIAFYFSQVMDKLGRSASLVGLGLLFLAGGWALERVRPAAGPPGERCGMTSGMRKGLIVAAIHLALVGSLGAKLLIDRATRPRVWARTAPVDPDHPLRGRYVRMRVEGEPIGFGETSPAVDVMLVARGGGARPAADVGGHGSHRRI